MDSASIQKKLVKELRGVQDIPGLIIKLQTAGLLGQLEKALSYAYESTDYPDDNFKAKLNIILDQMIDSVYDSS